MEEICKTMAKILLLFLYIPFACVPLYAQQKVEDTQDCEQVTKTALEQLVPIFQKNDFENLESVLNTIQSTCGENELTERLRILRTLIEKKPTDSIIGNYILKGHKNTLEVRWKSSADKNYAQIYTEHKTVFNFIPLRHTIDSLTKIKALALLNSPYYELNELERPIVLLLADHVDEIYQVRHEKVPKSAYRNKSSNGISFYAGAELPLTSMYPLFKTSPTFGIFFSSRLSNPVLVELGMKIRFNNKENNEFEYLLHNEVEVTSSEYSVNLGGTVGYKVFDNNKIIVSPKIGLFWDMTETGVGRLTTTHYTDEYGDSYEEESVQMYHINTMRTTVALAAMHHLSGKTYIGLEAAYHYVPYHWDKHLLTRMQSNYGSLQLFFRF